MKDDMMKKISDLGKERLNPEERAVLYSRIEDVIATHPLVERSRFAVHRNVGVVVTLSLFLLSGSVSFAAERALPGDVLYPVKVHVNEGVVRVLARTSESRASVAQKEVSRRAEEAEALIIDERLDDSTKAALAADTQHALDDFTEVQQQLRQEGKEKEAKESTLKMKEALKQHKEVLAQIGIDVEDEDDEKSSIDASSGEGGEDQNEQNKVLHGRDREDDRIRGEESVVRGGEFSSTTSSISGNDDRYMDVEIEKGGVRRSSGDEDKRSMGDDE